MKRLMLLVALIAGCHGTPDYNVKPAFLTGTPSKVSYDGTTNDLLTGGLGKSGIGSTPAPGFVNPADPTAAELRTLAVYSNYRALVDTTTAGGYGSLYGPNIDVNGADTGSEGFIAGDEYIAYDDDGSGTKNVTMMVQVPASFDKANPCIVTATSSGSRGVYGAIGTAGDWGLKHKCAVAYTDKGTGNGIHDLQNNTVNLIDGRRQDATVAGKNSNFTAPISDADRASFNANYANRFAVKQAHSQQNSEKDWGTYTLHAVEFAYYVLNEKFGTQDSGKTVRYFPLGHIITIAASVSNGGGAALAAAEQDTKGLISGVVAGEPQVQVASTATIQRGGATVPASAKTLYDYTTLAAMYQACAALSSQASATAAIGPNATLATNRCTTLQSKGLLTGSTTAAQADDAVLRLSQAGWESESPLLYGIHFSSYASPAVAVTYANAYARASVKDNLCNYSFGGVDGSGNPAPASINGVEALFGNGNGIPPTGPIQLINNASVGGPKRDQASQSLSAPGPDYNTDGVLCLRSLQTGTDASGAALTGTLLAQSTALKAGVQEALRTARLRGVPTILVQGRADTLVPVNHASRAYLGANRLADGPNAPTVYYEVEHAQHFDAFLPLAALAGRFVPLHRYVIESLDLMYAHLKNGAALPASQVVRTTPRGYQGNGTTPNPITPANVPPIAAAPAAADQITFANGTLSIPN